ncbi:polysaccharide biosynthesis/export family protein [candidate division KSB1 bacterium]|nr:polysaccharide biosynthesis/export family protein [candidate division KSB1 bacterium]
MLIGKKFKHFSTHLIIGLFVFIGAMEVIAAPGSVPSPQSTKKIMPGDALRIFVWQAAQRNIKQDLIDLLTADYIIDGDGNAIFPIVGRVRVKGMTVESLEGELVEKYKPYIKNPIIIVTPLIRVVMQGAFNKPGSYRIDAKSSLWELVELAGGPAENCDLKKMRVERSGGVVMENLLKSFEYGYSLEDVNVRSGDQIIAPYKGGFRIEVLMRYATFIMTAVLFYVQIEERR